MKGEALSSVDNLLEEFVEVMEGDNTERVDEERLH